ncbi:hypothetical protein C240_3054 [Enterococcus sp. 5H]|nr:hypothetical protein [Enterococcus sp. 5H]
MINEYIQLTRGKINWTEKRKKELFIGLQRTKLLSVTQAAHVKYVAVWSEEKKSQRRIAVNDTRTTVSLLKTSKVLEKHVY